MALLNSPALSKFEPAKRAKIALAWANETIEDRPMTYQDDIRKNALAVVNAGRKARGLAPFSKLESDDSPDEPSPVRDTSEDDYEPDPDRPGKVRRKKNSKDEIRPDEPERPRIPTSEEQEEVNGRALQIVNAGRKAKGLKPLSRAEFIVIDRNRG